MLPLLKRGVQFHATQNHTRIAAPGADSFSPNLLGGGLVDLGGARESKAPWARFGDSPVNC